MNKLALILAVVFFNMGPRAAKASEPGPRWFHVDAGFGYAAGSVVLGEAAGAASIMAGMSHPLAHELRATFELGYHRVAGSQPEVEIPEFHTTRDPSTIVTALIGFELYGPSRGGSGPFVREAFGLGYIANGADHFTDNQFPGSPSTFVDSDAWGIRPAIDLSAGFRRLPKQGGLALRVGFHFGPALETDGDALTLGLGF